MSLRKTRLEFADVVDLLVSLGEIICDESAGPKIKAQAQWLQFTPKSVDNSQSRLMAVTQDLRQSCWSALERS